MSIVLIPGNQHPNARFQHYYLVEVDDNSIGVNRTEPIWLPSDINDEELIDALLERQIATERHYLWNVGGKFCIFHNDRQTFERMSQSDVFELWLKCLALSKLR